MNRFFIDPKKLETPSEVLMLFGIVALCQPWNATLHAYGFTLTLLGLVAFNIVTKLSATDAERKGNNRHDAD